MIIILVVVLFLLIGGGVLAVRNFLGAPSSQTQTKPNTDNSNLYSDTVETNTEVKVDLTKSKEANTVVLKVDNLQNKYTELEYEVTYDSAGLIKGVNSGSKPIDIANQGSFSRDVYLGTCSKNVCKPDTGVTKVSVVLQFTDTSGKKSQFSEEYPL